MIDRQDEENRDRCGNTGGLINKNNNYHKPRWTHTMHKIDDRIKIDM